MRIRTFVLGAMAAFMAATTLPATAGHSWNGYHWGRTDNPFTLKLGDNVSGDWDAHLGTTAADWSRSGVLDATVVAGGTKPKPCKATQGRVEVCSATYGRNGWLGLAQIWLSGGHIVKGVAKMNDTYFRTSAYNDPAAKLHVMCQEVGHTLGLDHQGKGVASCMNDQDRLFDPAAAHPNQHDYDELADIYAHTDSTDTVSLAASGKGNGRTKVTVRVRGPFVVVTLVVPVL
ncbi:MAG TPA: hypothetical protein VGB28_02805 [Actinomycetota bacterium]